MPIPSATYRLQFSRSFTFRDARRLIPYLKKLGISTIYASPIFKARQGSSHGYDVVDPTEINPELGSRAELDALLDELHKNDMSWLQDIVPNHMAFDSRNHWLMDVFEKGRASRYYRFFDIEWKHIYRPLKGRLLAPVLGRMFSQCLEEKEIQLVFTKSGLNITYYDVRFPLYIRTYGEVLFHNIENLREDLGEKSPIFRRYRKLKQRLDRISREKNEQRADKKISSFKKELWQLCSRDAKIKKFLKSNIDIFNGKKGDPESFALMERLLAKQVFRLSIWKFATEEINYRRFFNINQLICLRIEREEVFERTHRLLFDLAKKKAFIGVRVDHIDGLYDPQAYLRALRHKLPSYYLIVEKILEKEEKLPRPWPVQGTTGYDFMNVVNELLCRKKNERSFTRVYERFIKHSVDFKNLLSTKKRLIVGKHMAGDIDNLAHHMKRISSKDRYGKDITQYGLKRALVEVLVYFPVYRTYIDSFSPAKRDETVIKTTIREAQKNNPSLSYELAFIRNILLFRFPEGISKKEKDNWLHFVMRFQQFTGPLMAKGFEDTTLYIYNRLISLNEVGSSPDAFGSHIIKFHHRIRERKRCWPHAMNATSSHDTKRGEDIRARINVLSEMPARWEKKVNQWRRLNENKKRLINGRLCPDLNDEYFIYQTLIGGFPFGKGKENSFKRRLKEYLIKAIREAKVHTAWIQPDKDYEKACLAFTDALFARSNKNVFWRDFLSFQEEIANYGIHNSISQILIKMTSVGVPDIYQGSELWDLSFVDPDNRRAVDFKKRDQYLKGIITYYQKDEKNALKELYAARRDGRLKLFLTWRLLWLRKRNEDIFEKGLYEEIRTGGKRKGHVIAFRRSYRRKNIVVVAPRFFSEISSKSEGPLGDDWKNTHINLSSSKDQWHEIFTQRTLENKKKVFLRDLTRAFPWAVLTDI